MRLSSLLLLTGLVAATGLGQAAAQSGPGGTTAATVRKHLVYFRDKAGTPFTVGQPQQFLSARAIARRTRQNITVQPRDLPVNPSYVAQVKAVPGATVWYSSRWFNAVVVNCDSTTLGAVQALPFVRTAQTLNRTAPVASPRKQDVLPTGTDQQRGQANPVYGTAYEQARMIGAVAMHNAGFRGEGMQIAVFDDGFPGVNTTSPFASLRSEGRLLDAYNFVERNTAVYGRDSHGTNTLSTMAANETGVFVGTAPKATYRLYLTEDVFTENPIEEVNWLVAAERADSAGVDIISSSLGYRDFDVLYINYAYSDLNGRTAISTRAAAVAARVGMLVVNSAGNEGARPWQKILAPADADSILAVGAVDSLRNYAGFSSQGPSADNRVKPNLAAQGSQAAIVNALGQPGRGSGTSFACPVLAGMVAGFWQANPTLTAQQVISFLQRSASQYTNPDNLLGYGIPNFVVAYNLANPGTPLATAGPAGGTQQLVVYPNPLDGNDINLQLPSALRAQPLLVRFYDARGALVLEQRLAATTAAEVRLPTSTLTAGIYTCAVQAGAKVQRSVRFVKI
ncbi:S8 family peptidase [Hymenobacter sp. BT186]|uniref:S8 family peptidase n=1 Tax=Hymenobacter telluris TaxID=2816474 RepID=A0A939JCL8_9BACT|nr:S8 family peptidase [Hymenobacter telluris]MBO0358510.1 S8 family peptidase [Hymenobacter telluris]MBW3374536.1 S8 family peptidase [Hymenobacter norwichensis]